ncbi:MAG: hypothetical protein H7X93_01905, partial [Sphingomonadaceae bacterium]|nr:hypothetical protein [Sphingomonadaceae bacterium]
MREAIALNRFGLGAKPTDRVPSDPRGWLLGQLGSFEARPPAIASAMTPTYFFEHFAEYRQARRAAKEREGAAMEADGGNDSMQGDGAMAAQGRREDRRRQRREARDAEEESEMADDQMEARERGGREGGD